MRLSLNKIPYYLVLIIILQGCYPIYKNIQPSADAIVTDVNGMPIEGAQVELISSFYPYGLEESRESKFTDIAGKVSFPSKREWRIESLMIHGVKSYFWNWCISKENYLTYYTENKRGKDFDNIPTIKLKSGISNECSGRRL